MILAAMEKVSFQFTFPLWCVAELLNIGQTYWLFITLYTIQFPK